MPLTPDSETLARLDAAVEAGREGALADLARLCALPSVSAKGEALEPCAELVADLMRARGLEAHLLPTEGGPPVVFGEAAADRADAPTVLFYNHYDVQPAEPLELWQSPPFTLTVRGGKAYARGAADDKGHIVSRLLALETIRAANGGKYPFHVKFLAEGEEEVGSPHLGAFVQTHRDLLRADACIWEEGGVNEQGRPTLYCGMRGIAYFELSVKTIAYDAHSGVGGSILPNAAWRLVWALSLLKDRHERILLPGHYDTARLPDLRDLQLLDALPDEEAYYRREFGLEEKGFLGGPQTHGLEFKRRAVFEPTLTICGLTGGWQGAGAKTVLPSEARARWISGSCPIRTRRRCIAPCALIWTRGASVTSRYATWAGSVRPASIPTTRWCGWRRKRRRRSTASPPPSSPSSAVPARCGGFRAIWDCPSPAPASSIPASAPMPPTSTSV